MPETTTLNIRERHARRCQRDGAAWRLLRADKAPLLLAFVADLFAKETEVAFGRTKVGLDEELTSWSEAGLLDSDVTATTVPAGSQLLPR